MIQCAFLNEQHDLKIEINCSNCGINIVLRRSEVDELIKFLNNSNEEYSKIGKIYGIDLCWLKDVDVGKMQSIYIGVGNCDDIQDCAFGISLTKDDSVILVQKITEFAW